MICFSSQDRPCQFVVDSLVVGASESYKTAAYRLGNFRDKLLLDKLSPQDITWQWVQVALIIKKRCRYCVWFVL